VNVRFEPWYGVVAFCNAVDTVLYEGPDEETALAWAERGMAAYPSVCVLRDGESWKWGSRDVSGGVHIVDAGFCWHPECGQVGPSQCFCETRDAMVNKDS
jgi:hypothetical protein